MRIYIDIGTGQIISDFRFNSKVTRLDFKRGDAATLEIAFVEDNAIVPTATLALTDLEVGIKEAGKYDGSFLVFSDSFTTDTNYHLISPSFNTTALNEALNSGDADDTNDVASIDTIFEITWSDDSGSTWSSTKTITARIFNDVIDGSEGTPLENATPDAYVEARAILYDRSQTFTSTERRQGQLNAGVAQLRAVTALANGANLSTIDAPAIYTYLVSSSATVDVADILSAVDSVAFTIINHAPLELRFEEDAEVNGTTFSRAVLRDVGENIVIEADYPGTQGNGWTMNIVDDGEDPVLVTVTTGTSTISVTYDSTAPHTWEDIELALEGADLSATPFSNLRGFATNGSLTDYTAISAGGVGPEDGKVSFASGTVAQIQFDPTYGYNVWKSDLVSL